MFVRSSIRHHRQYEIQIEDRKELEWDRLYLAYHHLTFDHLVIVTVRPTFKKIRRQIKRCSTIEDAFKFEIQDHYHHRIHHRRPDFISLPTDLPPAAADPPMPAHAFLRSMQHPKFTSDVRQQDATPTYPATMYVMYHVLHTSPTMPTAERWHQTDWQLDWQFSASPTVIREEQYTISACYHRRDRFLRAQAIYTYIQIDSRRYVVHLQLRQSPCKRGMPSSYPQGSIHFDLTRSDQIQPSSITYHAMSVNNNTEDRQEQAIYPPCAISYLYL